MKNKNQKKKPRIGERNIKKKRKMLPRLQLGVSKRKKVEKQPYRPKSRNGLNAYAPLLQAMLSGDAQAF